MIARHSSKYAWVYLNYLIVVLMVTKCGADCVCDLGYYCDVDYINATASSNTSAVHSTKCVQCYDCNQYHRLSLINCSREVEDCGPCLPGYANLEFDVDDPAFAASSCSLITAEAISTKDSGTNALLIFAIILPGAGLIVLILALVLGRLYHRRIVKKAQSAQELLNQEL